MTARDGPLYLQIYHRIRTLILTGVWPVGTQLPSSRALAQDLKVSRNTAIIALEKLVADGWIIARPGSGMYVSSEAPPARRQIDVPTPGDDRRSFAPMPLEISEAATDIFNVDEWSKIQRSVWLDAGHEALHEGNLAGWPPLRSAVCSYLNAVRGVACSPDQVFIVAETQAALDVCMRVLCSAGDRIWIENPGYPYARAVFELHGLTQVPVTVDFDGIDVGEGARLAPRAKVAYVTTCCQFPTTSVLSPARRSDLLRWADAADGYVIEDDWDFNAAFGSSRPPEPLAATNSERVILVHSFNRILFPALRIAALVVPQHLVTAFEEGLFASARFQNTANQMALARFIDEGRLSAHLRKVRTACEGRRAAMSEAVHKYLWKWVSSQENPHGNHRVARMRTGTDSAAAAAARAGGIACVALNDFVIGTSDSAGALLLGFAAFDEEQIDSAVQELRSVLTRLS